MIKDGMQIENNALFGTSTEIIRSNWSETEIISMAFQQT